MKTSSLNEFHIARNMTSSKRFSEYTRNKWENEKRD